MADDFIQPPANTGAGNKVDCTSLTVGANVVDRQRINLADPANAAGLQNVVQVNSDAAPATNYASEVKANAYVSNGTTWDRAKSSPGAPGVPSVNTEGTKATFSGGGALTPPTAPTDVVILNGSASKTIRVTRVEVSIAATAAGLADVMLIRRSAVDTGGTSAAVNVAQHDTADAAASATLVSYSVLPTLGTAVATVRAGKIGVAANGAQTLVWNFTDRNSKGMVLRGVAQGLAINLNGDTLLTGEVMSFSVEWTEE